MKTYLSCVVGMLSAGSVSILNLIRSQTTEPCLARHRNAARPIGAGARRSGMLFISCVTALLFSFAVSFQAGAITLNFANLTNTEVSFGSNSFSFTALSNGYQFAITSQSGGIGDSVGLQGYITPGGPFTIGTITTIGAEQTAPVTGTGMLHITDASSIDLTGSVQWLNITTFGVGGILDLTGTINLTGLNYPYPGSNNDLGVLAGGGSASDVVSFQFVPAETLTQLATTGGETSYSGSIYTVTPAPEPGTLTLVGMGLAGFLALGRRRKK